MFSRTNCVLLTLILERNYLLSKLKIKILLNAKFKKLQKMQIIIKI